MAAEPTVVHLRRKGGAVVVGCDVYVGRAMYQGGWRLPTSKWANPFRMKEETPTERTRVLTAYREHVESRPELLAALPELAGKSLGCWCIGPRCLICGAVAPRPAGPLPCSLPCHLQCHAEVLVALFRERVLAAPAPSPEEGAAPPPPPPAISLADLDELLGL